MKTNPPPGSTNNSLSPSPWDIPGLRAEWITEHAPGWFFKHQIYGHGDSTIYLSGRGISAFEIYAGAGNDTVYGSDVFDYIYGQAGADVIYGGGGYDHLDGDTGDDKLYGEAGKDYMLGGEGNDVLKGGSNWDHLDGGAGIDWLYGGEDHDGLYGGADNDYLFGGDGNDALLGGSELGPIQTGPADGGADGDDYLDGGNGDDILNAGGGTNILVGGNGADIFSFNMIHGVATFGHNTIIDFNAQEDELWLGNSPAGTVDNFFKLVFNAYVSEDALIDLGNGILDDRPELSYVFFREADGDAMLFVDSGEADAIVIRFENTGDLSQFDWNDIL